MGGICEWAPIHAAVATNSWNVLTDLINLSGADIDIRGGFYRDKSPLHYAILNGSLECIDILLSHGADPNVANRHGQTVLHWLSYIEDEADQEAVVRIFRDHNADPDVQDLYGHYPLCYALDAASPDSQTLSHLITHRSFRCSSPRGLTILTYAVLCGREDLLDQCIAYVDINKQDTSGWTPSHYTIAGEDAYTTDELVKSSALATEQDILARHDLHATMLELATNIGNVDMFDPLLQASAGLSTMSSEEFSMLHLAARNDKLDITQCLLSAGANPCRHDGSSKMSLDYIERELVSASITQAPFQNDHTTVLRAKTELLPPTHAAANADEQDEITLSRSGNCAFDANVEWLPSKALEDCIHETSFKSSEQGPSDRHFTVDTQSDEYDHVDTAALPYEASIGQEDSNPTISHNYDENRSRQAFDKASSLRHPSLSALGSERDIDEAFLIFKGPETMVPPVTHNRNQVDRPSLLTKSSTQNHSNINSDVTSLSLPNQIEERSAPIHSHAASTFDMQTQSSGNEPSSLMTAERAPADVVESAADHDSDSGMFNTLEGLPEPPADSKLQVLSPLTSGRNSRISEVDQPVSSHVVLSGGQENNYQKSSRSMFDHDISVVTQPKLASTSPYLLNEAKIVKNSGADERVSAQIKSTIHMSLSRIFATSRKISDTSILGINHGQTEGNLLVARLRTPCDIALSQRLYLEPEAPSRDDHAAKHVPKLKEGAQFTSIKEIDDISPSKLNAFNDVRTPPSLDRDEAGILSEDSAGRVDDVDDSTKPSASSRSHDSAISPVRHNNQSHGNHALGELLLGLNFKRRLHPQHHFVYAFSNVSNNTIRDGGTQDARLLARPLSYAGLLTERRLLVRHAISPREAQDGTVISAPKRAPVFWGLFILKRTSSAGGYLRPGSIHRYGLAPAYSMRRRRVRAEGVTACETCDTKRRPSVDRDEIYKIDE